MEIFNWKILRQSLYLVSPSAFNYMKVYMDHCKVNFTVSIVHLKQEPFPTLKIDQQQTSKNIF